MTDEAQVEVERRHGRPLYVDPVHKAGLGMAVGAVAGVTVNILEPTGIGVVTALALMGGGALAGFAVTAQKNKEMSRDYRALKDGRDA